MIKKLTIAGMIAVFGFGGFVPSARVQAQTVDVSGTAKIAVDSRIDVRVRGALENLSVARERLQKSPNDAVARRDHVRNLISVLRERIAVHKRLRAADKELSRTLSDEDRVLVQFEARVKNAKTDADLRAIADEIRSHRENDPVRKGVLNSYVAQLTAGVRAAERRSDRIEDILAVLSREGKDTAALLSKLAEADRHISAAAAAIATVATEVNTRGDIDMRWKASLKGAADDLKVSFRLFTEIVTSAKAL